MVTRLATGFALVLVLTGAGKINSACTQITL